MFRFLVKFYCMLRKLFFILLAGICLGTTTQAQVSNNFFENSRPVDSTLHNRLFLSIDNTNFLKNNEYFNPFLDGYTLIGWFLNPALTYYPTRDTRIRAGFHFLKYSGLDKLTEAQPFLSFEYQINPSLQLVLGTIYGGANHRLSEPMYSFEHYYVDNLENGMQFRYNSPRIFTDFWVNWEQFIMRHDTIQEEITGGLSSEFQLLKPGGKFEVAVPLQLIINHHGGQINDLESFISTLTDISTGLNVGFNIDHSFFKKLELKNYFFWYRDLSPTKLQPYKKGNAVYPNFILKTRFFDLGAGYWWAEKFIAPKGEPLFQSVSSIDENYKLNHRELITAKLLFERQLQQGIRLGVRFESYYDPVLSNFDYSYGINLLFQHDFFLKAFPK